ncbi:MAG: efflux RND transporter permease subunit [Gammaproteobacteria bacterium]|nr:efflux RND transporter permease subunit [Gammaproteobacteria bacterium]
MIHALIRFSLTQRLMLLLAAAALMLGGVWAFTILPIDAFPELSPPQVQVIVNAPGLAPAEVESRVAFPLEMEMQGIPHQQILRSTTKYSLSNIIIDFEEGTDIYWARQQVAERLNQVKDELPGNVEVLLAPIATPMGDVFMYQIKGEGYSNTQLRTLQDWVLRPRLRALEGVADVNSLGGLVQAFEIIPDPKKMLRQGLSIHELENIVASNNRNAGGDRINHGDQIWLVRTEGQLKTMDDIRRINIVTRNGVPLRVGDVALVREGALIRYGGVTANASGEIVTGLVLARIGANTRRVVEAVKRELAQLAPTLPKGVSIETFYDRTDLINAAVWTVEKALGEAVILVILVLIILLGNLRAAVTVALILPLSVLSTFILMKLTGLTANLMSLGGLAIAIGILVDAAVVVVENIHSHLNGNNTTVGRLHLIYRATCEVATPVVAGVMIIIVVFLPLFSLSGLEGRMFTPLAMTIAFALASSLLLSLTVIPVLASILMRDVQHGKDLLTRTIKSVYIPVIHWALRYRRAAIAGALLALLGAIALFPFIGKEFLPSLDEGSTIINLEKSSDISLEASLELDAPIQQAMLTLPQVTGVICRNGADELRLDPMGFYQTDCFLQATPRDSWGFSYKEFENRLRTRLKVFEAKGVESGFSQPINMRVSEMLSGVRADVAVKLFGDDFTVLERIAGQLEAIVKRIPGATDVFRARLSGQGYLNIVPRSAALARYGLNNEAINDIVETAVAGKLVTQIIADNRRIGVLLRYPEQARHSPADLRNLLLKTGSGAMLPLGEVAQIQQLDGPVLIQREATRRQLTLRSNVSGRDVVGFVAELKQLIAREINLPEGYHIKYGGQFENQQRAAQRLALVVPVSVALIFFMLFSTFGSLRQALLVILNIPFALIGGVVCLYLSGLYLSVPASVGFITLFGVAVLNGVVMVTYFNQLRQSGLTLQQAVVEGATRRLRPVLMTALIASLGLVPMLLATGPGSELQRPLAVVVIGGLFTSTLLTLVLLPTLYAWLESRAEDRLKEIGA